MLKSFFSEISSRPSCYSCAFKTLKRCSDFTIYDCWSAEKLQKNIKDDDKGFTNVIAQSGKAEDILKRLKNEYIIQAVDLEEAIKYDGSMVLKSAVPHKLRESYYKALEITNFKEHVQIFIPITKKDYLIEKMKSVCYKIGVFKILKKFLG